MWTTEEHRALIGILTALLVVLIGLNATRIFEASLLDSIHIDIDFQSFVPVASA
jgi:small-conductance mechanosensitive channel